MPDNLEGLTDTEIKNLRSLGNIVNELYNDPATRKPFLKMIRDKKIPGVSTNELDTAEDLEKGLAAERAERAKLEAKIQEQEIKDRIRDKRMSVVRAGLVDE